MSYIISKFIENVKYKIDYICSVFDLVSLKFLYQYTKFPYFKNTFSEILALDTLSFIKSKNSDNSSTGMASIKEINRTLNFLN